MSKYRLVKKDKSERDKFIVTIVADASDGDYVTTVNRYSLEEFENHIVDALIDLQENYSGHHMLKNYFGEHLDIPCSDFGVCHTLVSVSVEYIGKNGEIWEVELCK